VYITVQRCFRTDPTGIGSVSGWSGRQPLVMNFSVFGYSSMWLDILLIFFLILVNGFFSGASWPLFAIRKAVSKSC